MKKGIVIALILILVAAAFTSCTKKESSDSGTTEPVNLVFTSWRTEDIDRMNRVNAVFTKQNPEINVLFQPINDTEYDAQMRAGLETGTGADILFLRSYDTGRTIYDSGHLKTLNTDMAYLTDYPPAAVKAWSADNGEIYGVPSVGVTHGVYYQKETFAKYGLSEPETWSEFIQVCETLLNNGEVPISQGGLDDWTLYECVFSGIGANFYGGEEARQKLMAGELKLTDPQFVAAFEAVNSLKKYFPKGYTSLDYVSMQQMFGTGQAAMFIGGSWEIGVFEDLGSSSEKIGWFAPPVINTGDTLQYCFHVDAGIGMNKSSKNPEAALTYMNWTASPEYAQLFMDELPGFFSYTPGDYSLANPLAKAMIDAATGADLTVRTVWEKMSAQSPSGNSLMGEALPNMVNGQISPEEAAKYVQDGLATWYKPFQ